MPKENEIADLDIATPDFVPDRTSFLDSVDTEVIPGPLHLLHLEIKVVEEGCLETDEHEVGEHDEHDVADRNVVSADDSEQHQLVDQVDEVESRNVQPERPDEELGHFEHAQSVVAHADLAFGDDRAVLEFKLEGEAKSYAPVLLWFLLDTTLVEVIFELVARRHIAVLQL